MADFWFGFTQGAGLTCLLVSILLETCGCVGKPAICATTWSASSGVEQSVYDGRVHPTAEVSVGGELGSDKCKESEYDADE